MSGDRSSSQPKQDQPASHGGRILTVDDLKQLYARVKGAPYANSLIDAADALKDTDFPKAIRLVEETRRLFEKSHARHLRKAKGSNADTPVQLKKQEKCLSILGHFDDTLVTLRRMTEWERTKENPSTVEEDLIPLSIRGRFREEFEAASGCVEQLDVIRSYFDLEAVQSERDVKSGKLYYLRMGLQGDLVRTIDRQTEQSIVHLAQLWTDRKYKPLSVSKFIRYGVADKIVALLPKVTPPSPPMPHKAAVPEKAIASREVKHLNDGSSREVLDMGAFSQLMDSARRSGLVPDADRIAHVRDREFRMKKYQQASQAIEGLYGKFSAAVTRRDQVLRREELDIASGRIRISPKELQAKRARDRAQTQCVERARRGFQRVMEGLRILMQ